ncbi:MAG: thioesterase family protein [bacterium]|nr:thioesterase family protein [bacterium]
MAVGNAHVMDCVVRFAETDAAKVVHHSQYLVYFELGRVQMLTDIGYPYHKMQAQSHGLAPVDIRIQYLSPLRFGDAFEIHTQFETIGKVKAVLDQWITCDGCMVAKASVKLASLDEANYKIVPIPDDLIACIAGKSPHE